MRCIFCKHSSYASNSVEHIIPQSLGNKSHVLPKGIVCDSCNNYFAVKVERQVLQLSYFVSMRGRNTIKNKKRKIPSIPAFIRHPNLLGEIDVRFHNHVIDVAVNDKMLLNGIEKGSYSKFYLPYLPQPPSNDIHLSRLLGKMCLEALVQRLMDAKGWESQVIDNEAFDELRGFVRFGNGNSCWPYHVRRIYPEGEMFSDQETGDYYQVLHEYDFLIPDIPDIEGDTHHIRNLYFICCIMGMEYTINLTSSGLGRYIEWLKANDNKSILIMEKDLFDPYKTL